MSIFGGAHKGGGPALPIVYISLQVALANLAVKLSAKTGHPKTVKHRVQHTVLWHNQIIHSLNEYRKKHIKHMEKTKATISLEGLDPLFRSLPFGTKKYSKNPSLLVIPVIPKGIQVRKTRNLWTRNDHRWVLRANENARRFSRPKSSLNRLWSDDCGGSFSMPWIDLIDR